VSGLWTPPTGVALLRMRPKERTVTLPTGERVKVTVDDSGTVTQVEHNDTLDAIVRPQTIRVKLRRETIDGIG
jgi:hypothetical protein